MELTNFEKKTVEAVNDCKGAVKNCGRNALRHLEKAWEICDIDLEMAVFRGITAEEEASSSLFYTLKNQSYKNSKKIMFKEHKFKQALYPYIKSVMHNVSKLNEYNGSPAGSPTYQHITHNKRKALRLHFKLNSAELFATPTPPLHFSITESDTGEILTFDKTFKEAYQGEQFSTALEYVKNIAGERNSILYADAKGIPVVSGDIPLYLEEQKQKVFTLLHIMLLIDPWAKEGHSAFVQQALDAFLLLLEKIEKSDLSPIK